jgi:isoleucyl-tRNA synthetase
MTVDYKSTIFLPRTDFPMRANLPQREPELLEHWDAIGLYRRLRAASAGRDKFVLHDGPPYANGHLHIGHALNKILKDVINRSQQMFGRDANYVPGWDCHGLPIEWEIEKAYRQAGKNKDEVPILDFRRECREFAEKWIGIQSAEFRRLGVCGDWDDPYTTMAYHAEASIVREIGKFLVDGSLYKGARPVMWSVVEKTSLAEAEIEYHDHTSKTIWVRFPVAAAGTPEIEGAAVLIWTTTPWTIPGNRAVAYSDRIAYAVVEVTETDGEVWAQPGEKLVIAKALIESTLAQAKVTGHKILDEFKGSALAGTVLRHPFHGRGYDFDVPLAAADFVTAEDGTGFVHIAPGHGADDYVLGQKIGIQPPQTVGEDGRYFDHVPLFAGAAVYTEAGKEGGANEAVIKALVEAGALLARGRLTHSYPCSWRSKAPLIFRNTTQWFIAMDRPAAEGAPTLRETCLKAIDATAFYPASGQTRLRGMIAERPDWNVSRQRAWGVPLPIFVDKKTGEPLRDQGVIDRIAAVYEEEGGDAWFASPPARFLGEAYDPDDYDQVTDVVEVWFDSGATHGFVLEDRPDLEWPASLYLEGSDQHRGWFHSSLLESCGTRGRAPYDSVLTHGFTVDEKGYKMSKSMGNTLSSEDAVKQYGADVLRLWVVGSDYSQDVRVGPEILKQHADGYRRLRNTLRYLLGNLAGFDPAERVEPEAMPELDRWVLHRLWELDRLLRQANERYDFHVFYSALHNFCAVELSAFYFDIRKDSLYCDRLDDPRRRAARTVLDSLFDCLAAWLAPVLAFTAEEAWRARFEGVEGQPESVHLRSFPEVPAAWRDDALAAKWAKVRALRRVVTGALEVERAEKRIGSSLEAAPLVHTDAEHAAAMAGVDLAEIGITSAATLTTEPAPDGAFTLPDVPAVAVVTGSASGRKCARCWKVTDDVGVEPSLPEVCGRCADAVAHFKAAAE